MNDLVPDLAMVPKLLIKSALVIPTPVSIRVRVLSSLFGMMVMSMFLSPSRIVGSVKLWYLILSKAYKVTKVSKPTSEAFSTHI